MELIENNTYRYIAVGFGGFFLVPQIIHGYKRNSLEDLSTITIIFILCSSLLWTYYMYEMKYTLYVYISGFVSLNALLLIFMQLVFYYKRFNSITNVLMHILSICLSVYLSICLSSLSPSLSLSVCAAAGEWTWRKIQKE